MKRLIFLISFLLITVSVIWGQGQISRPKKTEQAKKETPQQTPKTEQTTSEPILPNSTETINGITVKWNAVTQSQKEVISALINNMIYIEGGSFMMGTKSNENFEGPVYIGDAKPYHKEALKSFKINKYEVTQEIWKSIMGNNPSYFNGRNLPVESVSWDDCINFINKINNLTGLTFRLPSEIEWEYAAKGGSKSNHYKYSGSNTLEHIAWTDINSNHQTHSVGSKLPNELGLFDMSGNVSEWTFDKYSINYSTLREGPQYINRGGDWRSLGIYCDVTIRESKDPSYKSHCMGFRLAL